MWMLSMRKIRTTAVIGCPRSYQNSLIWNSPKSPIHIANLKGNFIHFFLEQLFTVGSFAKYRMLERECVFKLRREYDGDDIDVVMDEILELLSRVYHWVQETGLDLRRETILAVEYEVKMPIVDDYWLVGHIDLLTDKYIIDFKTSQPLKRSSQWQQLGVYRELAMFEGYQDLTVEGDWELYNVFFGGTKAVEYGPSLVDVEKVMPKYYERLDNLIQYDRQFREDREFRMPCEVSILCAFCDFRCFCSGY